MQKAHCGLELYLGLLSTSSLIIFDDEMKQPEASRLIHSIAGPVANQDSHHQTPPVFEPIHRNPIADRDRFSIRSNPEDQHNVSVAVHSSKSGIHVSCLTLVLTPVERYDGCRHVRVLFGRFETCIDLVVICIEGWRISGFGEVVGGCL